MGGTTAKAGVIYDGEVLMTGSALIGGYATGLPVQIPMIDIQEVGTGGGSSRASRSATRCMSARKARAPQPGPVCYGLGGSEPTITDANLVLGRLGADRFLGGEMRLDLDGARARARRARSPSRSASISIAAADGILRIATTKMSHVVRWVTTERGLDAADFPLVAYGGAGPAARGDGRARAAHRQGRRSRARPAISRPTACWSRICGAISSTPGSRRWPRRRFRPWKAIYAEMERRGRASRAPQPRSRVAEHRVQRAADMRYVGQEHAVTVELPVELFQRARIATASRRASMPCTRRATAIRPPDEKAEIVSLRSAVTGADAQADVRAHRRGRGRAAAGGVSRHAAGLFRRGRPASSTRRPIDRRRCSRGNRIAGPALIEEYASTTVVHPGDVRRGRCLRRPRDRDSAELTMDAALKRNAGRSRQRIDPVTTEIVRNGLIAATEEMKTNLMRTAYNMIIYEALDFTVGLFDARGQHRVDRARAADVHPRHERHGEDQARALRRRRISSPATSC